jgi:hypothetical protein
MYGSNLFYAESVLDSNHSVLHLVSLVVKHSKLRPLGLDTAVDRTEIILELPDVEPAHAHALWEPH